MIGINKNHYNNKMYYKIILKNNANKIAECIYGKIREIKSENRDWLVNNTNGYIFNHLELPLYSKEDLEKIIYDYGIQKAIEKFIIVKIKIIHVQFNYFNEFTTEALLKKKRLF